MAKGQEYQVEQVGTFSPKPMPVEELGVGEVGFIFAGIKTVSDAQIGDTITEAARPALEPFPGFKEMKPMVFAGLYPGRRQRVSAAARRAREAAAERRLVPLRAGDVAGARLRVPLRLPRPAPHGDRPGAARARVRRRPDHDRAGRSLPRDDDRRRGAGDRQPGQAARRGADREDRGAGHHRDDPDAVDARRRRSCELCQEKRGVQKGLEYLSSRPRAGHLRAAVQRGRARLLRPAEDDLARLRLARLSCDRLLGIAAGQDGHPGQRGAGRRAVDHRPPRRGLRARAGSWRRRCAS